MDATTAPSPRPGLSLAGVILEDHRNRAGLTKSAVAKRMNTCRAQYDRVTRQDHPTLDALTKAARAVGVTGNMDGLLWAAGYDPKLVAATRSTGPGEDTGTESVRPGEPVMRLAG